MVYVIFRAVNFSILGENYTHFMEVKIEEGWRKQLKEEFEKDYFTELSAFVREEYKTQRIYPPGKLILMRSISAPLKN